MPGVATAGRARGGSFHHGYGAPLRAPSADTASQQTYYAAEAGGAGDPQRFSYDTTTISSADKRLLFAQGRPMAKDSSGSGSAWATGTLSGKQTPTQSTVESRLFFSGTVTATDMSRATDKREKDRLGIFGTSNSYAGSYGRVTSESIGRDLNPNGRGDGKVYFCGAFSFPSAYPANANAVKHVGTGNSINNCVQCGGGGGSQPGPNNAPPSTFWPGNIQDLGNCWHYKGFSSILQNVFSINTGTGYNPRTPIDAIISCFQRLGPGGYVVYWDEENQACGCQPECFSPQMQTARDRSDPAPKPFPRDYVKEESCSKTVAICFAAGYAQNNPAPPDCRCGLAGGDALNPRTYAYYKPPCYIGVNTEVILKKAVFLKGQQIPDDFCADVVVPALSGDILGGGTAVGYGTSGLNIQFATICCDQQPGCSLLK